MFHGSCDFGQGSRICVLSNGKLEIGNGFLSTANSTIICSSLIDIGEKTLVSWDTLIMDTDFHQVLNVHTGEIGKKENPIRIG